MTHDDGRYFQFKLCLLSFGQDVKNRLAKLMIHSALSVGAKDWVTIDDAERDARFEKLLDHNDIPVDFDGSEEHKQVLWSANLMGLNCGSSVRKFLEIHAAVESFQVGFQKRYGPDPWVRVRRDVVFETYNGKFPYRRFATFAAVNSVIGSKAIAWVPQDIIMPRFLGYRTAEIMRNEIEYRADAANLPSRQNIRTDLNNLEDRGFLVRMSPRKRITYFSNSLRGEHFANAVKKAETAAVLKKKMKMELTEKTRTEIAQSKSATQTAALNLSNRLRIAI